MLKPSFTFLHPHCLQVPLSALRATFPKGDSILPKPSRKRRMCVASPLGKLSRQRLKGHLLLLPAPPDVNQPIRLPKPSFTCRCLPCLHFPLSPLRATFPKGDSILPVPSRKRRMCAASPLGKLSRQRLKGHLLLLTTPPDVNHPLLRTQAIFHLSPLPLPAGSPFGPPGHFPQRGQHSPGTVTQATDVRGVPSGEAVAPATEGASALADDPARCKPSSFAYSSHLSPFATPIACRFPFRPFGPLSPKGTALSRNRRASKGCAWRPPREACCVNHRCAVSLHRGISR